MFTQCRRRRRRRHFLFVGRVHRVRTVIVLGKKAHFLQHISRNSLKRSWAGA